MAKYLLQDTESFRIVKLPVAGKDITLVDLMGQQDTPSVSGPNI